MEDGANDRVWMQLPDRHELLMKCIKTLIPYEDRDMAKGLGWVYDLGAWVFPLQYMTDIIKVCEEAAPEWEISLVDTIETPYRWWEDKE